MSVQSELKPQNLPCITDQELVYQYIKDLNKAETREKALTELSKKRESVPDLAPWLWHSPGAIAALLQEICAVYYYINPPILTAVQSNRVCNALALLQVLAAHADTRGEFLRANIPFYLYSFLSTNNQTRPFEYLRLTSLGVIGTLVKTDDPEVINFLLSSGIIPLCLTIMENGSELSRTVATFIMEKLLLDENGLQYICQTYRRFYHVANILGTVVAHLVKEPSGRLLKHVVRCYLRLSDHNGARGQLAIMIPAQLTDGTFDEWLNKDQPTKRWLHSAMRSILGTEISGGGQPSNMDMSMGMGHMNLGMESRPGSMPGLQGGANLSGGSGSSSNQN